MGSASSLSRGRNLKRDAEGFDRYLRKRFARFNLALAGDKTRLLFGRFAADTKAAYDERPETFDFLGFTHVRGTDRRGAFAVVRLPSRKSCRKFLARTKEWLSGHRHWKQRDQQRQLTPMLRGFYSNLVRDHF
jgi:RNA-directed DNA polymerase